MFADLEPTNIMGEHYKLKIEITEIISVNDWWYMSCKDCWLKVKKESDTYKCSTCANPIPIPRRKKLELMVRPSKLEVETKTVRGGNKDKDRCDQAKPGHRRSTRKSNARKETW